MVPRTISFRRRDDSRDGQSIAHFGPFLAIVYPCHNHRTDSPEHIRCRVKQVWPVASNRNANSRAQEGALDFAGRVDVQLGIDLPYVIAHRVLGDIELIGDARSR